MKATITVENRREAQYIRAALEDRDVRAFVMTMGVLAGLPTPEDRRRVLAHVRDFLADRQAPLPLELEAPTP